MRFCLILSGEVQIDIRCFFISGIAKEGLKGDIKAVPAQLSAAAGTVFFRHVRSAAEASVGNEFREATFRTDIVRRERIHFGNAGHICYDGGSDTSPAADQIAVFQ